MSEQKVVVSEELSDEFLEEVAAGTFKNRGGMGPCPGPVMVGPPVMFGPPVLVRPGCWR